MLRKINLPDDVEGRNLSFTEKFLVKFLRDQMLLWIKDLDWEIKAIK